MLLESLCLLLLEANVWLIISSGKPDKVVESVAFFRNKVFPAPSAACPGRWDCRISLASETSAASVDVLWRNILFSTLGEKFPMQGEVNGLTDPASSSAPILFEPLVQGVLFSPRERSNVLKLELWLKTDEEKAAKAVGKTLLRGLREALENGTDAPSCVKYVSMREPLRKVLYTVRKEDLLLSQED